MIKKFKKLSQRHNKSALNSFCYEIFIRVYRYSPITRALLSFFLPVKHPKNIFFIVGAYNAGTTIIKRTVAAHPSIASLPIEGDLLTSELSNMEEGGWHRGLYGNKEIIDQYRKSASINADQLLKDWSPWVKKDHCFLEKSIANSVRVAQLRKAFSGCKFINVIRSPDGVISGIKKRSKPTDKAKEILGADTYPDSFLYCQWSYIYGLIKQDSKPEDTFNCSYEKFISNPKESTETLYAFLGLDTVPITFESDTLQIGENSLFIRPMPEGTKVTDYSNPELFEREIKKLSCDNNCDEKHG